MLADEALFDGHPVAHIVAYYQRMREHNRAQELRRNRAPRRPIS